MEIETRVAGIPCCARLTHFYGGDPGRLFGPPEHCYPPEPQEMDWTILDRRGRPAPWLERKMTDQDVDRIADQFLKALRTDLW
jgi:hypothetical protein